MRVLVIDDDPLVCQSIEFILAAERYQSESVINPLKGLDRLEQVNFDLVVSDYWMPELRGDQLIARIKARHPAKPIILVSAFYPFAKPKGVHSVLMKPFSVAEMRTAIQKALSE